MKRQEHASSQTASQINKDSLMKVFAHRGVSALFPENSFSAIEACNSDSMSGIEIDIIQVENDFIVFHDRWLTRLLGIHKRTVDIPLNELQDLKLKDGNPVPNLAWLIENCTTKPDLELNIELKHIADISLFIETLQQLCELHKFNTNNIIISSFQHQYLHSISTIAPNFKLGLLLANYPLDFKIFPQQLSFYSVHLDVEIVDLRLVKTIKQLGFPVYVYTVDNQLEIDWLISINVDGIFANNPSQAYKYINNLP